MYIQRSEELTWRAWWLIAFERTVHRCGLAATVRGLEQLQICLLFTCKVLARMLKPLRKIVRTGPGVLASLRRKPLSLKHCECHTSCSLASLISRLQRKVARRREVRAMNQNVRISCMQWKIRRHMCLFESQPIHPKEPSKLRSVQLFSNWLHEELICRASVRGRKKSE